MLVGKFADYRSDIIVPRLEEHDHILVPRGRDPSGLRQESTLLAAPNFGACAEYSFCVVQPNTFVIFDNESVNRGKRSRFLAQTRRTAASGVSGDENDMIDVNMKFRLPRARQRKMSWFRASLQV